MEEEKKKKGRLVKTDKKASQIKGISAKALNRNKPMGSKNKEKAPWPEGLKQDCSQINLSCMSLLSGSKDLKELHCLQHMPQTPSPALETFHY